MKTELKFRDFSKSDLCSFAERLACHLKVGDSILINGPVGVGKTFFISCLIKRKLSDIGILQPVTSPTFNLVQIYDELDDPIWHFDLYRLEKPTELIEIGLEQAFHEAICLVEWPDILDKRIVARAASLSMRFSASKPDKRDLDLILPEKNFNNEKFYSSFRK